MKKFSTLIICLLCLQCILFAQLDGSQMPQQTAMAIPVSPAYQMLNASSSLIATPGVIRDPKVDWSFLSANLTPNIAIEAQPVWAFIYNKPTIDRYQNAGGFLRTLSTLSISAGSLDFNDSIRWFSYAGKITLYRSFDPLLSKGGFKDLNNEFTNQKALLDSTHNILRKQLEVARSREQIDSLERLVFANLDAIDNLISFQKQRIHQREVELKAMYWNATNIDVAAGNSSSFNHLLSDRIDKIGITHRSIAYWINGGFGIGRRWLITAQAREESISVPIIDSGLIVVQNPSPSHDSLVTHSHNETKNILSYGLNIRYGSPTFNFFVELFITQSETASFDNSNWTENSSYGEGGQQKSSNIDEQSLVAFGGEWKINSTIILNFGIRNVVDQKMQLRSVTPIASISCIMR